ncbi:MAG: CotH kinase family protein [Alphaproteobacteria bacterium]|nr:CotH kinase family protein [Alphaproteobacteria bacterium]
MRVLPCLLAVGCSGTVDTVTPVTLHEDTGVEPIAGPTSAVFDDSFVHTLHITLSPDSVTTLSRETEPYGTDPVYVPGDIVWDDVPVANVGVRIKGRWGTWRPLDEKASFKIDMNRYVSGQDLDGFKALTLNNLIIDCSFMREPLAYPVYEAVGIPGPRTSYVEIFVNDELYGLYLNVETPDDRYLERHFDHPEGPLYDADYILWGNGSYTVLDYYPDLVQYFELEEGEDPDHARLAALVALIEDAAGDPDFYERTAALWDWDHHHRMVAGEMWTGQNDGYSLNQNNYLTFLGPEGERARVLPWDHDYAFLHARDWGFSWDNPDGRMTALCLDDPACRADQLAALETLLDRVPDLDLPDRAEAIADLIDPYIEDDPRRECSWRQIDAYRDSLDRWFNNREGELRQQWGL